MKPVKICNSLSIRVQADDQGCHRYLVNIRAEKKSENNIANRIVYQSLALNLKSDKDGCLVFYFSLFNNCSACGARFSTNGIVVCGPLKATSTFI